MLKFLILLVVITKIVSSIKLYRSLRVFKNANDLHSHVKIEQTGEMPIPKEDELLLKMKCCGVCHTDLHLIDAITPPNHPVGHEGVGEIIQLSSSSQNKHGLEIGDIVGVPWMYFSCGNCQYCITGHEPLCVNRLSTGLDVPGAFQEFMIAKSTHVVKKPNNLSNEAFAPFLCAGVTTYKALKECDLIAGNKIGIIGAAGGLGSYSIQYAKAMGFQPIAIDLPHKLDFCKQLGAETVAANNLNSIKNSCDAVIVLAPNLNSYSEAIDLVKRNGKVVFVSLPEGKFECDPSKVVFNHLTLKGSIVGTREDMKEALDFASRGLVKSYIETDSFENIDHIFQRLRRNDITGRIVVNFDK